MSNRVIPDKLYETNNGKWEFYSNELSNDDRDANRLKISAVTYTTDLTGATLSTLHSNPELRSAAHIAWSGARHSRAPGDSIEILQEMGDKGVDPDQKLEEMFQGYGHASVGDMAPITVHFNNVPMHVPMNIFNLGVVNSGQEKSTRYQKQFNGAALHPLNMYLENVPKKLEEQYQNLGKLAIDNFNKQKPMFTQAYEEFYKPVDKKEKSSLDSRVLDTVRFNLLLGQSTGFVYETSARDFAKTVSYLKSSELKYYQDLGEQLETILSPNKDVEEALGFKAEAPSLIRHTQADNTTKNNLIELKKYLNENHERKLRDIVGSDFQHYFGRSITLNNHQSVSVLNHHEATPSEKLVAQYILAAYPAVPREQVLNLIDNFDDKSLRDISKIIFNGHTKYIEMPQQLATPDDMTVIFEGTLGELRDFNRHRAWGRFMPDIPLFNGPKVTSGAMERIIMKGWGLPSYVMDVKEFDGMKRLMNEDFKKYYDSVSDLFENTFKEYANDIDYHFMINVLPLGHMSDIWMHGNMKQAHYMGNLRIKPGGHINYRQLAYDAMNIIKNSDPIYSAMITDGSSRPSAISRQEFFDRS